MPHDGTPNNDLRLDRVGFPVVGIQTARHKAEHQVVHRIGAGPGEGPGEVGTGLGSVGVMHHKARRTSTGLEEAPVEDGTGLMEVLGNTLHRLHIG